MGFLRALGLLRVFRVLGALGFSLCSLRVFVKGFGFLVFLLRGLGARRALGLYGF